MFQGKTLLIIENTMAGAWWILGGGRTTHPAGGVWPVAAAGKRKKEHLGKENVRR
jgi:hypothetical protein